MKKDILKKIGLIVPCILCIMILFTCITASALSVSDAQAIEIGQDTQTIMQMGTFSYYKVTVDTPGTIKFIKSKTSSKDPDVYLYKTKEAFEADEPDEEFLYIWGTTTYEITKAGTYYLKVCSLCTFRVEFEANYVNMKVGGAKKISVGMNKSVTVTMDRMDGTTQYYYLSPDDKSYYTVELLNYGDVRFFKKDGETRFLDTSSAADIISMESKKITVNKGDKAVIIALRSLSSKNDPAKIKITRTDFIDIKKLSFSASTFSVTGSKVITLKADLGKDANGNKITKAFESKLTYTMKNSKGQKVSCYTVDKKNKLKITVGDDYNGGVYTLTVKTSEGVTATATFKIGLSKMNLKGGTSSEGTTSSSTVSWTAKPNANLYYVYLLKNGKYTKVASTTATRYTFKKLKADTVYSFRLAPVIKTTYNGKTIYIVGEQSQTWKFITAKTTKPTISSVKCTGCKYYQGEWHSGRYDSNGIWHEGYRGNPYSIASIKVTHSTIKGATHYYSNGSGNTALANGTTYNMTFSGKKKSASTTKVKIRARYSLNDYNSYAFGPWSSEKSVTIPAAK